MRLRKLPRRLSQSEVVVRGVGDRYGEGATMKITIQEFVSLDGVMQGPGGRTEDGSNGFERGGWVVPFTADPEFGEIVTDWFTRCDELLLGRSTYQMMYDYWSRMEGDDPVTATLNHGRKHVVSSTLTDETATWENTTVIADGLDGVRRLKDREGGELQVHGSWQLAHALHNAGLVDEYRLLIFPTVVGDGKRLFDGGSVPSGFEVVQQRVTPAGLVSMTLTAAPFATAEIPDPDSFDVA
jgi:dihydrofolate reductase